MNQLLTIVVGVSAIAGILFVLWRPHWTFVVVVAMFPLEQLLTVYIPIFRTKSWLFNVMVGLMAVFAVATRSLRREQMTSGLLNPTTLLIWALYALWYVGYLYTPAEAEAAMRIKDNTPYMVLLLVLLPLLIVDIHEFRKMVTGLMILGTAVAVLIILNPHSSYYSGRLRLDLGMVGGSASNRGNPLALGELGGTIALAAALIKPLSVNPLFTALRLSAFFAGFGLAIGSGSRGQVLAAGITGVMFFPMARRLANPKQFVLNCVGFGILVFGIFIVFKLFIGDQNRQRWDVWQMMQDTLLRMDMVGELFSVYLASPAHWLFGLGTQAFAAVSTRQHADYVHNVAAEILCQHGLVGFGLYLAMMWMLVKQSYRLWMVYRDDPTMRSVVGVLCAICFYGLLLSLKQGSICFPQPFYWWIVLAKLSAHEEQVLASQGISIAQLRHWEPPADDALVDSELAMGYGRQR